MDHPYNKEEDSSNDEAKGQTANAEGATDLDDYLRMNWAHLVADLVWNFQLIKPNADLNEDKDHNLPPYQQPDGSCEGCLKDGIAHMFNTPLECLEVCGGLTNKMVQ